MLRKLTLCVLLALTIPACTLLPKPQPAVLDKYLLEYSPSVVAPAGENAPVLVVSTPQSHGAYDTPRIAYMQQQYGLRYYTQSRWADTPARMLAPMMAEAINASGRFQALYASPGRVSAELRLDSELIRFHQDFTVQPSVVHITVRAQLVDLARQRVLASRLFDLREPAGTEDAYGGVQAANRALQQLLQGLVQFCIDNAP